MKRTNITLTDDIDGSEGATVRTVSFAWEGTEYEIDLSQSHREEFALAIGRWLHAARPAKAKHGRTRTVAQRDLTRAIRAWAISQGYALADRGRIPDSVGEAYWAAHTEGQDSK